IGSASRSMNSRLEGAVTSAHDDSAKLTITSLKKYKDRGEKFASITAYDATFAEIASTAGIDVILVGDSLGMVVQGHDSTLPVTMEDVIYHLTMVQRGNRRSILMADMPFMTYYSEGLT